jgi:hypothetical protein
MTSHPEPFIVILDGVIEDCLPCIRDTLLVFGQNNDGSVTGFPIRFGVLGFDENGIRSRLFLHIDIHNDVKIGWGSLRSRAVTKSGRPLLGM